MQTLRFTGGMVDGVTMEVPEMPKFVVGQDAVLFVTGNGKQFCALIGVHQGRFHVNKDRAGSERITTLRQREGTEKYGVFKNTVYGDGFGDDTLAVTLLMCKGTVTTGAEVIVNSTQPCDSYRGPRRTDNKGKTVYDLRRVLVHEFGHVLGLDHTAQDAQLIMAPAITNIDTVQADDIAGVTALYVNPQYHLPTLAGSLKTIGSPEQAF